MNLNNIETINIDRHPICLKHVTPDFYANFLCRNQGLDKRSAAGLRAMFQTLSELNYQLSCVFKLFSHFFCLKLNVFM